LTAKRLDKGQTLDALHRDAGVSLPHLSSLERGTRRGTARTWRKIAAALGTTVADLKAPEAADPRQSDLFDEPGGRP
jgi:transcriptional regulator with XRE-family HTH domain